MTDYIPTLQSALDALIWPVWILTILGLCLAARAAWTTFK